MQLNYFFKRLLLTNIIFGLRYRIQDGQRGSALNKSDFQLNLEILLRCLQILKILFLNLELFLNKTGIPNMHPIPFSSAFGRSFLK